MLFKNPVLQGIKNGSVTLAFRRWKSPAVKKGSRLLTPIGIIAIDSIKPITLNKIAERDARLSGFKTKGELITQLKNIPLGTFYRIKLHFAGQDPRIALRASTTLTSRDLRKITRRLKRRDWAHPLLRLIAAHPSVRAGDLARKMRVEKEWLKTNVRKLKNLGLTESLGTGYRLSPRGRKYLSCLKT